MGKIISKNTLGVYISPSEICLAEAKTGGNYRLEVQHLVKIPTGFKPKDGTRPLSINDEFFNDKAPWAESFRAAVKKVSWGTSSAVVTFSPQFAILRYFIMPAMDRKFWSRSIPLEAKKYIPVSFEEALYDFNVAPIAEGKKLGILFGLTRKRSVDYLLGALKSEGLELASLEVNSCSLERLFSFMDPKEHNSRAYVHFFGSKSLTLFSSGGYPVMYRENDFSSPSALTERKRLDIKGSVQFVERYVGGQEYKNLMLSGENLDAWKAAVAQESQIPPLTWDPAKQAELKDNSAEAFFALGASIKGAAPGRIDIDLSGVSAAAKLKKTVETYAWTITSVFGGIMLLFSLIAQLQLFSMNSRISGFKATMGNASDLQGGTAEDIKANITAMQATARTLAGIVDDTDRVAPKLQAIADSVPAELWLANISYSSPLSVEGGGAMSTEMRFVGKTALTGDMKFRMVDFFAKSLKASPEFKIFSPPQGGIDSTLSSSGSQGGENVTEFDINCFTKRSN